MVLRCARVCKCGVLRVTSGSTSTPTVGQVKKKGAARGVGHRADLHVPVCTSARSRAAGAPRAGRDASAMRFSRPEPRTDESTTLGSDVARLASSKADDASRDPEKRHSVVWPPNTAALGLVRIVLAWSLHAIRICRQRIGCATRRRRREARQAFLKLALLAR